MSLEVSGLDFYDMRHASRPCGRHWVQRHQVPRCVMVGSLGAASQVVVTSRVQDM